MGDLFPGGPAVSSAERLKIDTGPANPCRTIIYSTHFPLGVLRQNNEIINAPMAYHVIDNFVDGLPKVTQKSWRFDAQREIIRLLPGKAKRDGFVAGPDDRDFRERGYPVGRRVVRAYQVDFISPDNVFEMSSYLENVKGERKKYCPSSCNRVRLF